MKKVIKFKAFFSCLAISSSIVFGQAETPAGIPYSPFPQKVFVTKVKHFDNMCWKIAAAGGTWYFENGESSGKTGFSSAFDQVGNDWIGNDADKGYNTSPKGTGKHEYRGFPNLGNGDFDHPQRSSGSKTKWVNEMGQEIPFTNQLEGDHLIMRSYNSKYEVEYHFFTSHIAVKIIKATDKYAFLYEGPIGGEQESNTVDKWYTKDGAANGKPCSNTGCTSPFIYFVDSNPKDTQILYLGAANLTSGVGGDAYVAANNMVVVSYGRSGSYPNDTRKLTGTDAISVIGFLNKADGHAKISSFIDGRLVSPFQQLTPINNGPVVSLTSPANNTSIAQNQNLTLQATATTATGTITKVEFYNGTTKIGEDATAPYSFVWSSATAGTFTLSAKATNSEAMSNSSQITVVVTPQLGAFGGTAHPIPGIIQSEDFDNGGNGLAYSDDSPGSSVSPAVNYRTAEDVDIEACTDIGGGYNIGYFKAGEWLKYTVNVATTKKYDINLRVACSGTGRTMDLQIGATEIKAIAIPNTNGWQTWETITVKGVSLVAGEQTMKVTLGSISYVNLNYIEVKDPITGLTDTQFEHFEIYPNPTNGLVNFSQATDWTLLNANGVEIQKGFNKSSVDLTALSEGIYFIRIENKVFKVVKQ
jgi:hypothetical protein